MLLTHRLDVNRRDNRFVDFRATILFESIKTIQLGTHLIIAFQAA